MFGVGEESDHHPGKAGVEGDLFDFVALAGRADFFDAASPELDEASPEKGVGDDRVEGAGRVFARQILHQFPDIFNSDYLTRVIPTDDQHTTFSIGEARDPFQILVLPSSLVFDVLRFSHRFGSFWPSYTQCRSGHPIPHLSTMVP